MQPLKMFIDMRDMGDASNLRNLSQTELQNLHMSFTKIKDAGGRPNKDDYIFLNVGGTSPHYNLDYSPCLTRSRCGSKGYWLSWLKRKMKVKEMWSLQGLPKRFFREGILMDNQLGQIVGNAIPVPLLAKVMSSLFEACPLR